ncbi:MAG: hypothetical protein Sapg2KO_45670 [Saprospiraceae bacterium]
MKEKNYNGVEDFLSEESFCQWVENESEADTLYWENWISRNPNKKNLVDEAISILKGTSFEFQEHYINPKLLQEEWAKIREKTLLKAQPIASPPNPSIKRSYQIRRRALSFAASILLLAAFGFLLNQYVFNPQIIYQTAFGEQMNIVLPDSTILNLNANSKLTYRRQNPRKVWLDGEAYFEVKKKPETGANFSVITKDLTVEVLGTRFNVLEKADKTEVILEEGSVKLNLKRAFDSELFMKPGELVAFSTKIHEKVEKRLVEPQALTSWKDGVLVFEDVPISEVMEKIKEIYGWKTVYQNEDIQLRKISIPLPSNDLESTLNLLQKAIGIEIEKVEKEKILLLK